MSKKNLWVVVCVVVFALVACFLLFVSPNLSKTNTNNGDNTNKNDEKFDKEDAKDLLKKFGFDIKWLCDKTVLDNEYSSNFKSIVAIQNVPEVNFYNGSCKGLFSEAVEGSTVTYKGETGVCFDNQPLKLVSYNDVNAIYQDLFGENMPKQSFAGENNLYLFYDYVASEDAFAAMKCNGCGGSCGNPIKVYDVLDTHLDGSKLVIDVANYYDSNFSSNDGNYHLVTDHVDETLSCSSQEDCQNKITNEYLDKLNLFSIQFEKSDDHYILKTISKK